MGRCRIGTLRAKDSRTTAINSAVAEQSPRQVADQRPAGAGRLAGLANVDAPRAAEPVPRGGRGGAAQVRRREMIQGGCGWAETTAPRLRLARGGVPSRFVTRMQAQLIAGAGGRVVVAFFDEIFARWPPRARELERPREQRRAAEQCVWDERSCARDRRAGKLCYTTRGAVAQAIGWDEKRETRATHDAREGEEKSQRVGADRSANRPRAQQQLAHRPRGALCGRACRALFRRARSWVSPVKDDEGGAIAGPVAAPSSQPGSAGNIKKKSKHARTQERGPREQE